MTDFTGLVAVVTGGASGIGAAVAEELNRRGAQVAIIDRAPGTANDFLRRRERRHHRLRK